MIDSIKSPPEYSVPLTSVYEDGPTASIVLQSFGIDSFVGVFIRSAICLGDRAVKTICCKNRGKQVLERWSVTF
jgi:hypothetical protein